MTVTGVLPEASEKMVQLQPETTQRPKSRIYASAADAVRDIPNGAKIMLGGTIHGRPKTIKLP
jgi:hypothetical protein